MIEMLKLFNPILTFIAMVLTFIASYTGLDLYTLSKTANRDKRFLFLGGTFSLGVGIWIMNFIGMIAINLNGASTYHIPLTILSFLLGILFTGIAFYWVINRELNLKYLLIASFFMTVAVLSIHITGMYAIKMEIQYSFILFLFSTLIIYGSFALSLWFLFYTKFLSRFNDVWIKPISALVITGAIIEGYFLLLQASPSITPFKFGSGDSTVETFLLYLVFFVSVLILSGVIGSRTVVSKRLAVSNTNLKDISFALDQSSIVAFTDEKGMITNVNEKFCEISMYSRHELIGQNHSMLNSGVHSKEFFKQLWRTIARGDVWKGEICNRAKDGHLYWVDTTIVPFLNESGKPYQYLAMRNDITERKKTEEILHRQDKLATVGQLAAGVAHEIRNPLTSMRGYTEFLQMDETNKERLEYFGIILDEIDRVNNIVEDFMMLAKPNAFRLEEKNILLIIKNVISLFELEASKKNIQIKLEYSSDLLVVDCDENRLKQVFINFVKNGIEAMPQGGELTIQVKLAENQRIHIYINDTGVGIPEEKLKNIGEPFYTTKKNGNGLGLMVTFHIIESHGGKVTVKSELNRGTGFLIDLPRKG